MTSESQTLVGISGGSGFNPSLTSSGTQSFTYDAAGRVTASTFDGAVPEARTYTYDPNGNRTSVTEAGVTFYYSYDRTDALVWKAPNADGSGGPAFTYDALGQLTASQPSGPDSSVMVPTTYAYDPAGHLTSIDSGDPARATSFGIDALGRHAAQTVGSTTTTYAYLGTSSQITTETSGSNTLYSAIDAIGDRLSEGTPSAVASWLVADLHGNVSALAASGGSPAILTAYRYDPYGETCGSWVLTGSDSNPWRFQGRILESASGATDLYDFGARSYDPSLGAFTSFDTLAGGAVNPLTLNRYLYALANPVTMIDPDGHCTWDTTTMSCVGTNANNAFNENLANQPVNTCLATDFHAPGCTSGAATMVCDAHYASDCGAVSTASAQLIEASDTNAAWFGNFRARWEAEDAAAARARAAANQGCGQWDFGCYIGQAANMVNQARQAVGQAMQLPCANVLGCFMSGFVNAPRDLLRSAQSTSDALQQCAHNWTPDCFDVANGLYQQLAPDPAAIAQAHAQMAVNGQWNDLAYEAGGVTYWSAAGYEAGEAFGAARAARTAGAGEPRTRSSPRMCVTARPRV